MYLNIRHIIWTHEVIACKLFKNSEKKLRWKFRRTSWTWRWQWVCIMSVQALISKCVELLHRSDSQTEQCSTWSLKAVQALICPPCLVHERVICLTPPTVAEIMLIKIFVNGDVDSYHRRRFSSKPPWFQPIFQCCQVRHIPGENKN